MTKEAIILLFSILVAALVAVIIIQYAVYRFGTQKKLRSVSNQLNNITETDGDERITLFTDNKELKRLISEINELQDKLIKVKTDYVRSEISSRKMLSNISHDIKTPMTVILGYLEIMRINGTATEEMIQKTENKAKSVMELITQFFTLAKLESGDMNLETERTDVCEICRESILDYYEILTNSGFTVKVDIPETAVFINADKKALQRILTNLISNAIRYGSDGKYLGISLVREDKEITICVTDKGKGIDKQFADKIFDRLFTLEDSRNKNIQGNGLGLTIAKNLTEQMGGALTLESEPYKQTKFILKFRALP